MKAFRTGIGFDVHRLVPGRPLILGGVTVPFSLGLLGHSDADVLLHAVGDALLGAAGLGDLGTHFPDADPAFAGAASTDLLADILRRVCEQGWAPFNVDTTVIAEQPRLTPHIPTMRKTLAPLLGLSETAVSVKATSSEGLGCIGRGEGIAALATVLITREE